MLKDKEFIRKFIRLTLPFSIQFLISSTVNLIDVMMIGRLGDAQIAAAGAANQIFFLLTIIQFGISSGASVFIAQYWGAGENENIKKVLGLIYVLSGGVSSLFTCLGLFLPEQVIRFYIHDADAVKYGSSYLFVVSISYIITAISTSLATVCRCTGNVGLPTIAGSISMAANIVGNAILIFGLFGAPALGLTGAAIATVIARLIEMFIILITVYKKKLIGAAGIGELTGWNRGFVKEYFSKVAPVLFNEIAWSVGTSLYMVAFGLMGTSTVAAVQIASAVAQILFVFVRGAGNATAVMLGNTIGEGREEDAKRDSRRFLVILPVLAAFVGIILIISRPLLLSIYEVSAETMESVRLLLFLHAILFIPKAFSVVMVVGILRSGGDTTFACFLDILPVWLFSVPFGFIGVKLGFPLWIVFLLVNAEDMIKPIWGIPRVLSDKWIHNLT